MNIRESLLISYRLLVFRLRGYVVKVQKVNEGILLGARMPTKRIRVSWFRGRTEATGAICKMATETCNPHELAQFIELLWLRHRFLEIEGDEEYQLTLLAIEGIARYLESRLAHLYQGSWMRATMPISGRVVFRYFTAGTYREVQTETKLAFEELSLSLSGVPESHWPDLGELLRLEAQRFEMLPSEHDERQLAPVFHALAASLLEQAAS